MSNHLGLFHFLMLCNIVSFVLILLAYLFAPKSFSAEKLSAYECGFEPFADARRIFDVHFYIVAVLFIIFDLEITFLVPWACTASQSGFWGLLAIFFFVFTLGVGFFYEWKMKALDWAPSHE